MTFHDEQIALVKQFEGMRVRYSNECWGGTGQFSDEGIEALAKGTIVVEGLVVGWEVGGDHALLDIAGFGQVRADHCAFLKSDE